MIDFKNPVFVKLKPMDSDDATRMIEQILVEGEEVHQAFKGTRDKVLFTNKRAISINIQGMTGKKVDYTSLPYSKVQAFSIETVGVLDRDCELELWFSGVGKVRFEFAGSFDIRALAKIIGAYVL
ncbi:MAG: PH domain-containing protein [Christensenellaceae bacterium]